MLYTTAGSESAEILVKGSEDMSSSDKQSSCLGVFDCLSAKDTVREQRENLAHKRASRRIGVERSMRLTYNQPHLVEPMKLTVYDVLPPTPITEHRSSQVSRLVEQGCKSISRASTRATRRAKASISQPQPALQGERCQLRRNPSFRPLQLSIYMTEKRLSDLPEFDQVSFTDEGEIKVPPRALVRTHSEDLLRARNSVLDAIIPAKPVSMFEQSLSRRVSHLRQKTDSTVISSSRPASEYDALHSHPVSWYGTASGILPSMQFATAPPQSRKILSPMQEEFTPPPSGAVIINGKVLAFPDIDAARVSSEMAHQSLLPPAFGQENDSAAPSPVIDPGPNRRTTIITQHKSKISEAASILLASSAASTRTRATTLERTKSTESAMQRVDEPRAYFHTDFKTQSRINHWLDTENPEKKGRSRQSSVSTTNTASTTSSFAEHRRNRSRFYQLNQTTKAETSSPTDPNLVKPIKAPTPLTLYRPFPSQKAVNSNVQPQSHLKSHVSSNSHMRTQTSSTIASSVCTDILFEQPETPELEQDDAFTSAQALPQQLSKKAYDAESVTTFDMKSRTGTMKSTYTSTSQRQQSNSPECGLINTAGEEVGDIKFIFRGNTPSPCESGPCTPLSAKTKDVEKMMFEMCAQSGYRRVNVGVAF